MSVFRPFFWIILASSLGAPGLFAQKAVFLDSFGAPGAGDGQLNTPWDLAVSFDGSVYVTDFGNHRIQKFSAAGTFERKWGDRGIAPGQFDTPTGICKAPGQFGEVYICDTGNNRIKRYSDIFSVAYEGLFGSSGGANGQLYQPTGVCHSSDNGQIYVADRLNHRIQRFDLSGIYLGQWGGFGSATGQFNQPSGVAVHPRTGQVYVSEEEGDRVQRFSATGTFQVAWGSTGSDTGQFNLPRGIAVDQDGLVYVADAFNDRIQVFDSVGRFLYQFGTDGGGAGQFSGPFGLDISARLLYVADSENHRIVRYRLSNESPKLTVTGAKTRTVASSSARFSGTARDDLKVDFVEVKVGSLPFRKAKGSSKWTFTAHGLKPGLNRVQIRAVDLGGRKSKIQTLRVSRS